MTLHHPKPGTTNGCADDASVNTMITLSHPKMTETADEASVKSMDTLAHPKITTATENKPDNSSPAGQLTQQSEPGNTEKEITDTTAEAYSEQAKAAVRRMGMSDSESETSAGKPPQAPLKLPPAQSKQEQEPPDSNVVITMEDMEPEAPKASEAKAIAQGVPQTAATNEATQVAAPTQAHPDENMNEAATHQNGQEAAEQDEEMEEDDEPMIANFFKPWEWEAHIPTIQGHQLLGMLSPQLMTPEQMERAKAMAETTDTFNTDFSQMFPETERDTTWKKLELPQLVSITQQYHNRWNTDESLKATVEQALLQVLLRVHLEVEEFDLATFGSRAALHNPDQILEAAQSFHQEPDDYILLQSAIPMGIMSPLLQDQHRHLEAWKLLHTTQDEEDQWMNNPEVQFAGPNQCSSDWIKLPESFVQTIQNDYIAWHQLRPDSTMKDEIRTLLVMQLLRIHCDVERLSYRSFHGRVIHHSLDQLKEIRAWMKCNKNSPLPHKLNAPRMTYIHEPIGMSSNLVTDANTKPKVYYILTHLLAGNQDPHPHPPSAWKKVPKKSRELLTTAIYAVWKNELPQDKQERSRLKRLMTHGFLRIHMEVERLPFEAFYPRFYTECPSTWASKLIEWKSHCAPISAENKEGAIAQ